MAGTKAVAVTGIKSVVEAGVEAWRKVEVEAVVETGIKVENVLFGVYWWMAKLVVIGRQGELCLGWLW